MLSWDSNGDNRDGNAEPERAGMGCPDVIGMGMLRLEEQGWHMDGDARMCLCRTRMVT